MFETTAGFGLNSGLEGYIYRSASLRALTRPTGAAYEAWRRTPRFAKQHVDADVTPSPRVNAERYQ